MLNEMEASKCVIIRKTARIVAPFSVPKALCA
jgi:hypothetical protein